MGDMDAQRVEQFMDRFIGLGAATTTIGLLAVADRSGLTEWLGEHGKGSPADIATGAGLDERYVTEICSGLAAAGVLEYDSGVFTLPPEHALFIADESSPYFMGGWFDMLPAMLAQIDGIAAATTHGGGIPFERFGEGLVRGLDRANRPSQRILLTRKWLPAVPGLVERLQSGIGVADVGCGSGTAAIEMARAFPESEVVGFDVSESLLYLATARAQGLANVRFELRSVDEIPITPGFDLITSFDVIHDLVDPLAGLTRIRHALTPEGSYLMMEPNASSDVGDNLNDSGALLYGTSVFYCMTQSLASGGVGLGAAWGSERAETLAGEAGFKTFQPLDGITNRFSAFYLLTA